MMGNAEKIGGGSVERDMPERPEESFEGESAERKQQAGARIVGAMNSEEEVSAENADQVVLKEQLELAKLRAERAEMEARALKAEARARDLEANEGTGERDQVIMAVLNKVEKRSPFKEFVSRAATGLMVGMLALGGVKLGANIAREGNEKDADNIEHDGDTSKNDEIIDRLLDQLGVTIDALIDRDDNGGDGKSREVSESGRGVVRSVTRESATGGNQKSDANANVDVNVNMNLTTEPVAAGVGDELLDTFIEDVEAVDDDDDGDFEDGDTGEIDKSAWGFDDEEDLDEGGESRGSGAESGTDVGASEDEMPEEGGEYDSEYSTGDEAIDDESMEDAIIEGEDDTDEGEDELGGGEDEEVYGEDEGMYDEGEMDDEEEMDDGEDSGWSGE